MPLLLGSPTHGAALDAVAAFYGPNSATMMEYQPAW
jgi:hypothetical protein